MHVPQTPLTRAACPVYDGMPDGVRVCMFYAHTREKMDIGAHTLKQPCIYIQTQRQISTHTCTQLHTHINTHVHRCRYKQRQRHIHRHRQTYTHTYTYIWGTPIHTYTLTHTYRHTGEPRRHPHAYK